MSALDAIRRIVGPAGWIDSSTDIEPYLVEQRGLFHGATQAVVRPASTEETAAVVRVCAEAQLPIVPQGGNTGLCGGGVPYEDGHSIVLSTGRMKRIRAIDPAGYTLVAEAGCILAELQQAAESVDRLFPLSLGAEGSCTIGGNISTNAGGIHVLRYGNTRDLVLGLEVVLADGRVWNGLRTLRKDNTGYDLKQLFIGGEGTLGIVTAAALRLYPQSRDVATAFVGLADVAAAMQLFDRIRAGVGEQLTAFELIPRIALEFAAAHIEGVSDPLAGPHRSYALIEAGGAREAQAGLETVLERALADGIAEDAAVAVSEAQRQALWHIREGLVEAQKFEGGSIKHDVSVPVASIADFIAEASAAVEARLPGIRPVPFGHAGDGNIHFNLTQPVGMDKAAYLSRWHEFNDVVHAIVARYGGSISAEHGLGRLKRAEIARYKAPVEIELMQRIKQALDPAGIMNPRKLLPDPR